MSDGNLLDLVKQLSQMSFDFLPIDSVPSGHQTIQAAFEEFDRRNPHIYRLLRTMALRYHALGHKRCSMKMLWEFLRFSVSAETGDDPYKLNNNYTALYSRKLMDENPVLAGFFETRERRSA
jgi:hypothetical protein